MDILGKTAYVLDDAKPASDTVLWSSLKTSRFLWQNKIVSNGSTLSVITPYNTATVLTLPFTGAVLIGVRANWAVNTGVNYSLNNAATVQLTIFRATAAAYACAHMVIPAVKTGDTLKFTTGLPNVDFLVIQI